MSKAGMHIYHLQTKKKKYTELETLQGYFSDSSMCISSIILLF